MAEHLLLVAAAQFRAYNTRHTADLAIMEWFILPRTVRLLWRPFLGMAVFAQALIGSILP